MSTGFPITSEQRAQMRAGRERMVARARKKGIGKRLAYAVQAGLLFPLMTLLKLMPVDAASAFGGWFGRAIAYRLIDRTAHYPTMRVAIPDLPEAELDSLLLTMCDNIGRVLGESMHLADFAGAENRRLSLKEIEAVNAVRAQGHPLLFVGGHFGNWELLPVAMRAAGWDGIAVVQHPNNPHVLEWIAAQRYRAGLSGQVAAEEGVYAALRRALKGGGLAAMLTDQRVLNGIKAPFFGLETMTNLIPARLARDLGAAVVLMSNRRVGGAQFQIEFQAPLLLTRTEDRAADELAFTARINRFYEEQILAARGYWLWGHPRFDDALGRLDGQDSAASKSTNPSSGDESGSRPD